LLVLDNLEHLLTAAGFVSELLRACPALSVLATSREALALAGEQRYPVAPLELPLNQDDAESLARVPAVALFCERARAHDPDFRLGDASANAVAEICRRVDGLPLAIELAAARCGVLSPGEIAERLDNALGALGTGARDAPARQRTLRATIDWSHNLLSDPEKHCFARFAVFAGGATVEATEAITDAGLDTLDGLIAKSLLVRRQHALAPTRLGMLETIRAYATERLAFTSDKDALNERHYRYYLALARRHGDERALWGAGRSQHLGRLDAEVDNLHAARAYAVGHADPERALAIAAALGRYWVMRHRSADALKWIEQALAKPRADAHSALRVRVLCFRAVFLGRLRRRAEQRASLAEAEAIARALGDPVTIAQVLRMRAIHESFVGRVDIAAPFADAAFDWAMTAHDDWELAMAAYAQAIVAPNIAELRTRVNRAASLLDDVGNVYQLADLLAGVGAYGALLLDSAQDALEFVNRATAIARGLDDPFIRIVISGNFGLAALLTGATEAAEAAFRDELRLCRELVVFPFASEALQGLAAIAAVRGDDRRAARLFGAAVEDRRGRAEDHVENRLDAEFFGPARARHGGDAWDAIAREGGSLSFEDAIAYALEEAPS
jgi:predicted ATPase